MCKHQLAAIPMETDMGAAVGAEPLTSSLLPHLVHIKSRVYPRRARPLLPLVMLSHVSKHRHAVAPRPVTWTRLKTHHCSLRTPGRLPVGRWKWPWMRNQSGCVTMDGTVTAIENEREIETGLLDVAVGTAVRAVRGAGAVVADTVESIATGHWPRGWDSNIFSRINN